MSKVIEDDAEKTRLRELISDPDMLQRIHRTMLKVFSGWALETPEAQPRILKYRDEFKTIISACLNAKTDVDEREVLLALNLIADEYAASIVLEHGQMVNMVEEPEKVEVTH